MASVAPPTASRPGSDADAVLGIRPAEVFSPETVEEASAALEEAARRRLRVVFAGGRTKMALGAPPESLDAVVETTRLSRVVEHAPSDQIVIAQAGLTLASLQAALAPHGQRLALDPPWPERATLGGIVAANAFGPLRARYGSVRDLLIGISFVRADGTLAHGGGKVVKNVAGFDLPKLMVGSLGTLGMIATAIFRLHPVPESSATVLLSGVAPASVRELAAAIRAAQLEPAAVVALASGADRLDLAVRFEGFSAGVRGQRDRFSSLVPTGSGSRPEVLDEAAAADFRSRHDRVRGSGALRAKVAAPRDAIEATAAGALAPLFDALEGAAAVWYPTVGLVFLSGGAPDPVAAASAIARARDALDRLGGTLVLEDAPAEVRSLADVWGRPPDALRIMQAVKERLDPERRLAPGRFVGGI
jgi:glycolate oxidase FAD binding subunit